MKKIIFIIMVLMSYINADSTWNLEQKSPLTLLSHHISSDGLIFASLYASTDAVEEGEHKKQYLQIGTLAKNWWMSNTSGFITITKMKFIDNTHLLIIQNSSTTTASSIINTKTKEQQILAGGNAEYIEDGKNKGLFIFHDRKGYFSEDGAFWVDELRNKNGMLIEVLSKPKNTWGCIPLKSILNKDKAAYPLLRQGMQDCVYVDR